MGLGPTELLIILGIVAMAILGFVPALWAAVDAALKPDSAWKAAGQSKIAWVLLPLVAAFVCGFGGGIAAGIYYYRVRPQVLSHT